MQIIIYEEQIERKLISFLRKDKLSMHEERILDFLELAQSATEIQDILSFSYMNICALGDGKYEIRSGTNKTFTFETDGTAVTVLSL